MGGGKVEESSLGENEHGLPGDPLSTGDRKEDVSQEAERQRGERRRRSGWAGGRGSVKRSGGAWLW